MNWVKTKVFCILCCVDVVFNSQISLHNGGFRNRHFTCPLGIFFIINFLIFVKVYVLIICILFFKNLTLKLIEN